MVKFWDTELDNAIKLSKFRIAHHEKHGNGDVVMKEKQILKKQERKKQLRKEKQ